MWRTSDVACGALALLASREQPRLLARLLEKRSDDRACGDGTEAPMGVANTDCEREMIANVYVRQLDEIAAREGCDLPVTLLVAMVRLFGEVLDAGFEAAALEARYGFTRCGAMDESAPTGPSHSRCVRRRGHAGKHFAAGGERWGAEAIGADEHLDVRRPLELLCFAGCGAVATHGRFCISHRGDG